MDICKIFQYARDRIERNPLVVPFLLSRVFTKTRSSRIYIGRKIFKELDQIPVYYCFSNIWKIDKLLNDINRIENINFDNNNTFLEFYDNNKIYQKLDNISNYFLERYLIIFMSTKLFLMRNR